MMILAPLGLSVFVYAPGVAGIPSTTIVDELSGIIESYSHTITHRLGFETMTCSFTTDAGTALDWLGNGLMRSCVVYGPDAEVVWEGFLETVDADFGGDRRSLSLRDMANRVRVRYTTVLDTPGVTSTASDTASQAAYGIKDGVFTIDKSDSTEAGHFQTTMLARLGNPIAGPSTTIQTGEGGGVQVTLSFAGWYTTLDWVLTSDTSTTKTSTTTQVGTLLSDIAAMNAFIDTDTANIVSSGITAVEFIDADTSYRQKIESLLGRGNGTNPYAWGVYEDRKFYADVYAGATPDTITYRRHLGDADLYDANDGIVRPWNTRPNAMLETSELLDVFSGSTAKDSAARFYVARVNLTVDANGHALTLEPGETDDLAAILITKYT